MQFQFHFSAGSRMPKNRQEGSLGVWLALAFQEKDVAPRRCASSQQVWNEGQTLENPMMCPARNTPPSSWVGGQTSAAEPASVESTAAAAQTSATRRMVAERPGRCTRAAVPQQRASGRNLSHSWMAGTATAVESSVRPVSPRGARCYVDVSADRRPAGADVDDPVVLDGVPEAGASEAEPGVRRDLPRRDAEERRVQVGVARWASCRPAHAQALEPTPHLR